MKLSTKGRYGLNAMYHLACSENNLMSLKDLSEATSVPQPYLEKLLGILRKDGLVTTVRGVQGGYKLSDKPENITIGQILRSLENDMVFTDCGKNKNCQNFNCPSQNIYKVVYDKLNMVLDQLTLKDMLKKYKGEI